MKTFLEYGFGFVDLKLSLEICGKATAVGGTTSFDKVEILVDDFNTFRAPRIVQLVELHQQFDIMLCRW